MVSNPMELLSSRGEQVLNHRSVVAAVRDLGRESLRVKYDLGAGDPYVVAPPAVRPAAVETSDRMVYSLGVGDWQLRRRIAELEGVDPERVAITLGATAACSAAIHVFADPGTVILVPDPGWGEYPATAALASARVALYPVDGDVHDLDRALGDAKRAVLVANNPSNPSGYVLTRAQLEEWIEWTAGRGIPMVVDQVFRNYVWEHEDEFVSAASFDAPHVVVVDSVSKSLGLTWDRIGWAISHPALRPAITAAAEAAALGPGTTQQAIALQALSARELPEIAGNMRRTARRCMDVALAELRKYRVPVEDPPGTFYLFPEIRATGMRSLEFRERLLEETGVLVVEGSAFGPRGEGKVRVMPRFDVDYVSEGCARFGRFYQQNILL